VLSVEQDSAMRLHPISLALQFIRGRRTFHDRRPFADEAEAVAVLRRLTGQDFGMDAEAWGTWLRNNRHAYRTGDRTES